MRSAKLLLATSLAVALGNSACTPALGDQARASFTRAYELAPQEGVFAYSRISPDGRLLAYASEVNVRGRINQTVTVVDLTSKAVLTSKTPKVVAAQAGGVLRPTGTARGRYRWRQPASGPSSR